MGRKSKKKYYVIVKALGRGSTISGSVKTVPLTRSTMCPMRFSKASIRYKPHVIGSQACKGWKTCCQRST